LIKKKLKLFIKSSPVLKRAIKFVRKNIYAVFNLANFHLKFSILKKIRKLDFSCQPFILTRHDLGTWLQILHYADLWQKFRGDVIVFVLSSYYKEILKIANNLYPNLKLISAGNWYTSLLKKIFGHFCLQTQTFNPIYGIVRSYRLDSIVLYDMPMELEWPFRGAYNQQIDFRLEKQFSLPHEFIDTYKRFRNYSQFRHDHLIDFGKLVLLDFPVRVQDQIKKALNDVRTQLHFEYPVCTTSSFTEKRNTCVK